MLHIYNKMNMIISVIRILFWIPLGSDILFTFDRIKTFLKNTNMTRLTDQLTRTEQNINWV